MEPSADRPFMPGYGIATGDDGLLPWSWARDRLAAAREFWLCTTRPDGSPHAMPVWGVWLPHPRADDEECLWFSSGLRSLKARNLARDPRCVATTADARDPVVVEGAATVVRDADTLTRFAAAVDAKYEVDYGVGFYDPDVNGVWALRPHRVLALRQEDFSGSPTRWTFDT